MPLSRLQTPDQPRVKIVIPDDLALEALGLNIIRHRGHAAVTNYSPHRVGVASRNGHVPHPRLIPIGVARGLKSGDIVALDDIKYQYINHAIA